MNGALNSGKNTTLTFYKTDNKTVIMWMLCIISSTRTNDEGLLKSHSTMMTSTMMTRRQQNTKGKKSNEKIFDEVELAYWPSDLFKYLYTVSMHLVLVQIPRILNLISF